MLGYPRLCSGYEHGVPIRDFLAKRHSSSDKNVRISKLVWITKCGGSDRRNSF
jgi:hypothetical protein